MENGMSRPKVWRSMWQATGRLVEKVGLTLPGTGEVKTPDPLVTRCPGCEQKLRYAPKRAGREAQCPRCNNRFPLPRRPRSVVPPAAPRTKVGYSALRERI
jgi:hypothetical protein